MTVIVLSHDGRLLMSPQTHRLMPNIPSLSRRQLLRRLGIATGAVASLSIVHRLRAAEPAPAKRHVLIIGAGLAGLCAAYELERKGHTITILEAEKQHIGGRARTLRFEGGLYGEAGAMRIPDVHTITRHYLTELGVPIRKFIHSNPAAYYFARGQRERIKDVRKLYNAFQLSETEAKQHPDDWWAKAVTSQITGLSPAEKKELLTGGPLGEKLRKLDGKTLQNLIEDAGFSPDAAELLGVTAGQEMELWTGATETLREELLDVWAKGFDEIVGGTDRLATAFVDRLNAKPRMGCQVTAIWQDGARKMAGALYVEQGQVKKIEADLVICTLPLPVLGRLRLDPAFSPAKMRAIRLINYDSATKVLAICNNRFWESEDGIFGGGTYTDLPTGTTYYPSDNAEKRDAAISAGPGVMLASYSWGHAARRLGALDAPAREESVLRHLSRVHPQLLRERTLRQCASWAWDTHPNTGGAFAWYLPGQFESMHAPLIEPEGRIILAGEHASLAHTWMQGAFESAIRCVEWVGRA